MPPLLVGMWTVSCQADRREHALVRGREQPRLNGVGLLVRQVRTDVRDPEACRDVRRRAWSETAASASSARQACRTSAPAVPRWARSARPCRGRTHTASRSCRPRDDFAVAAVVADGGELRRRARVDVPEVVVHDLEVPQALAGARIERDDRRAEQVGADAIGAVEVVGGRAERNVGDAARASMVISPQLLTPPMYFQASFGQVS